MSLCRKSGFDHCLTRTGKLNLQEVRRLKIVAEPVEATASNCYQKTQNNLIS